MGMEVDMDNYLEHDTEAVTFVRKALHAAVQGDREDYEEIVVLMDPSISISPNDPMSLELQEDKEALLVATLGALAEVVSHIDVHHHHSLYTSILGMSIWKCRPIVRDALIELVVCLASSTDKFLDVCLDMLVCHFKPPAIDFKKKWPSLKNDVMERVFAALQDIATLAPITPMRLLKQVEKRMPHKNAPKHEIEMYVECMLKLEASAMGEFIGSSLLKAVIDRLLDLDVDIKVEDILINDSSRGVFDIEMDDDEENAQDFNKGALVSGTRAETLDSLMSITYQHLELCKENGRSAKVFETLMESFRKTVLTAYRSKFVQFVMFYACSLHPESCGMEFPRRLEHIFLSTSEPQLYRMNAASYLASYLSRAKFIPSYAVKEFLGSIVDWCFEYCHSVDANERGNEKALNVRAHQVFYTGCQAVMYILCFHMRCVIDSHCETLRTRLESILSHTLAPLKVCLPSVVEEFLRQAMAVQLFTSTAFINNLPGTEVPKAFRGLERLDMFFPFDPYLLKGSDRFIRPEYVPWSLVRTTYDENDDLIEDGDEYEFEKGSCRANFEMGEDCDRDGKDELGFSLNAMSITPKSLFIDQAIGGEDAMPARIRPSTSPVY